MSSENPNSTINLEHSSDKKIEQKSTFFNNNNNNNNSSSNNALGAYSVTDSAYDSLVCSPFSPVIISNSNQSNAADYQENFPNILDSISPFLESGESDDVFKVSLEQIYTEAKPKISMCNSIFRPISSERELNKNSNSNMRNFYENNIQSGVNLRQKTFTSSLKSQRSISTQTQFSLGSFGYYRPNSAPLQEGIEEELSEIETIAIENSSYQIPRNSTYHCIRSPMPDLIQPTFQRDNQVLVRRLSFIADQIDQDMSQSNSSIHSRTRRTRRFSTPSLSEIAPGGSFFDLLFSIYHALDNRQPRQRSATYSYNENEEDESQND